MFHVGEAEKLKRAGSFPQLLLRIYISQLSTTSLSLFPFISYWVISSFIAEPMLAVGKDSNNYDVVSIFSSAYM